MGENTVVTAAFMSLPPLTRFTVIRISNEVPSTN